ncbi:ABC transporter substrate-binding subunit SaoX [Clostridioides difficile]|uniref:ABC transporter substrate-binding subunit SaoX n=1 Tax=Clostridioides difficile TaxID=1496 RepID=UPI000D1FC539|nr:ABC transporter substrate-binding subunit SaoX [Clostridioides difficile]MDV9487891.1 ABC transporter substrate-binding subunit SaoX [Clostridioides difficile]HBF4558925.1 ABC transporter substrate-binding protein [Clostridioides difficile]HCQ5580860.1 ABC transporter substrate-binding protein [Clostridioides difficile]
MKLSKKIQALILFGVMGTSILTGCSSKPKEKEEAKAGKDDYTITVGYYNCDHMTAGPVAESAGIYKDLGLNVKTVGNGKVPEAMAAGKMDAGYIGTKGLVGAIPKGSPITIAANNHTGGSEYLIVSKDIKEPKDLIGKKIATDMSDFLWTSDYGPETGLPTDPSKYEVVNMDSDKDKYLALKTGKIQAFTSCDPWGSVAENDGAGKIIASTQYKEKANGKEYNCCSFSLNKNFIKEHPDLAKKLVLAHTKAIEYIYTNPAEAAKIFAKYYNVEEEVALRTIYKKTVGEGRTLTWKVTGEEYKNNLQMYKDLKALDDIPKYEDTIDTSLLDSCGVDDFDKFIKEKVNPEFPEGMSYEDWKAKVL